MRKWTWLAVAALVTLSAVASAVSDKICIPTCCDEDPPSCCAAQSCPK